MASRILLAAALVAVHSLPALAEPVANPMITEAPVVKRSHHDIAARAVTTSPLPLTDYHIPFSAIPYQVNPYPVGRGPQSGYNECNATTEGPDSQCQTLEVNSLSDFCLWGSPTANGNIGDVEAAVVAYCTQPGHGGRYITPGSITAAQLLKTSAYIQITGLFNQNGINLVTNDTGGELDPHGADLLGNPLGGLVYSTGLPSGDGTTYQQAYSWNTFVGSGTFCIKICDNSVTSPNYCENRYDLIGCNYNMPAAYTPNEFTVCDSELQEVVGTYVSAGQTLTWSQPAELGTSTLPWQPVVPSSSNCQTYQSSALFSATLSGAASGAASTSSSSSVSTGTTVTNTGTSKGVSSGTTAKSTSTTTPSGTPSGSPNGGGRVVVGSGLITFIGAALVLLL